MSSPAQLPRSLVVWMVLACALFWFAPKPPEHPTEPTPEEQAASDRRLSLQLRDIQTWHAHDGDQTCTWDDARGHLAIIIDDIGRELHVFEQLLALRYRLTFSVVPGAVYTHGVQLRLQEDERRAREIMLHLPMEPEDAAAMTTGDEARETFLLARDSPAVLAQKTADALQRVGFAVGVNNHMGSHLTQNPQAMAAVMRVLATRHLYFIDSRTTAQTVAYTQALAVGVPAASRHVFLDHDPSEVAIRARLQEAATRAQTSPTIAIGHPSTALARVLQTELPTLFARGVCVFSASEVVRHTAAAPLHP